MALTTRPQTPTPAPVATPPHQPEPLASQLDPAPGSVARTLAPLLASLVGDQPTVQVRAWDGSAYGAADPVGTIHLRSPDGLRRMIWAPGELGLARAYVSGDLDLDGDVLDMLADLKRAPVRTQGRPWRLLGAMVRAARPLGALGPPLPPPPEEARPRGRRHTKRRDAAAISHHYDVGNDFYRLVLGPAMTYSCAHFSRPEMSLAAAQADKHELVCRKLGLHQARGARLLDVGCGWGSMAMHAALHHDASVVGITISQEQALAARARVAEAGLEHRVEIRLQDYRDLGDERFDAISSIGMFEHVGQARMARYFGVLRTLLGPGGRLLNHAISSVHGSRLGRRSFTYRYVFPDGELIDVAAAATAMEDAGFEVRDVESLREHYALTLRHWLSNLEQRWDEAVALVGEARTRVWRLYMAGSAVGFEDGGISVHQVLGVVPAEDGSSGMPATRDGWAGTARAG